MRDGKSSGMTSTDIARALGARHRAQGVKPVPKSRALPLLAEALRDRGLATGPRTPQPHAESGLWSAYLRGYYPEDYCAECARSNEVPHTDGCSLGMTFDATARGHAIKDGACIQCRAPLGELDFALGCPAGSVPGEIAHAPQKERNARRIITLQQYCILRPLLLLYFYARRQDRFVDTQPMTTTALLYSVHSKTNGNVDSALRILRVLTDEFPVAKSARNVLLRSAVGCHRFQMDRGHVLGIKPAPVTATSPTSLNSAKE